MTCSETADDGGGAFRRALYREMQGAVETLRLDLDRQLYKPSRYIVDQQTYEALESSIQPLARFQDTGYANRGVGNLMFKGVPVTVDTQMRPGTLSAVNEVFKDLYLPQIKENIMSTMPSHDHTYTNTFTGVNAEPDALGVIRRGRRVVAEHRRVNKSLHQYEGLKWLMKAKNGTVIRWTDPEYDVYRVAVAIGEGCWRWDAGSGSIEQLIDHLIRNRVKAKHVDRMVVK